jgi:ubiquinone/menaquinone biosynthesis C-methylase UbiE
LADVTFLCADARALPFPDASFDLVETDFLLQFLAPPERRTVLHEWARVLRPGGGLMTRDWVNHERGLDPLWDALRRAVLRTVLGVRTHALPGDDLREALQEVGFHATVLPFGHVPLIHLIAGVAHGLGK